VRGLHLEPSTQTLYSAGEDKKVKLWDLKTLTCATLFGAHTPRALQPQAGIEQSVASACARVTARLCAATARLRCAGHSRFIRAVAYNSTTKKLYSGGDDARVKMWEATSA